MTTWKPHCIFTFLLLILNLGILAQERQGDFSDLHFEHINTDNGLAGGMVRSILQDSRGFMWFGSVGGLNRYDGSKMKTYLPEIDNPQSIPYTTIDEMIEDHEGKIWIIGELDPNICRYDPEKDTFTLYSLPDSLQSAVKTFYLDSKGDVCLVTIDKGILRFNRGTQTFEKNPVRLPVRPTNVINLDVLEDSRGDVWQVFKDQVFRYSGKDRALHSYQFSKGRGGAIFEDSKKDIWVGGRKIMHYNQSQDRFEEYVLEGLDIGIHAINQDNNGLLWLGTNEGVYIFDPQLKKLVSRSHNSSIETSILYGKGITRIVRDRDDGMWIATLTDGVFYWNLNKKKFHTYQDLNGKNVVVQSFEETSEGKVWVSWNSRPRLFDPERDFLEEVKYRAFPATLIEDKKGWIWSGTWIAGVTKFHPDDGRIYAYYPAANWNPEWDDWASLESDFPSDLAPYLIKDHKGVMWVLVRNLGYYFLDTVSNSFKHYPLYHPETKLEIGKDSRKMYEDAQGNLWIGVGEALVKIVADRHTYSYEKVPADVHEVYHEDSSGNLWGFSTVGLFQYHPQTKQFKIWSMKDGLPTNFVSGVEEDAHKNLWISNGKGLSKLNLQTREIQNYSKSDGLPSNQFYINSSLKTENGEMYFGSINGFVRFHPDSIHDNPHIPSIIITDIQINGKSVPIAGTIADTMDSPSPLKAQIPYTQELTLSYWQSDLSFEFAALNYFHPEENLYKYKLEKESKFWRNEVDWTATDASRPYATYTNLSPGTYTFHVIGSNNDGVWNEEGASLRITIRPPFWMTIWAYLFYMLIGSFAVWALIRWRTNEQRKKLIEANLLNDRLQQVDKLKDQFLANTSHELRTPLNGIIGITESVIDGATGTITEETRSNLEMVVSSGKRLSSLVNDILDFSKLKNFDLGLAQKPIDLHTIVDIVVKNHAPLIKGKNLELRNEVPDELTSVFADENRLQQILYNLIGNAVKFTEYGEVLVQASASKELDFVEIAVKDTGIGIPEGKQSAIFQEFQQADGSISREFAGTGLGLSISKKLVELHGGTMRVESEVGKGSTFFFSLPVSKQENPATIPPKLEVVEDSSTSFQAPIAANISPKTLAENTISILVVDDEPINQQVLKNHLSGKGFELIQAMNGEEAIRLLSNGRAFDLVLLDVMMPRMSGYEVCQQIRERFLPSELPVIMITAKDQLQDIVQGLSLGANDYLPKPFHKDELLARIKTQLDLHRIFEVAGRFVPNEFLHSLNRERLTDVALGDFAEKEVTVLFSDIRGYTTLAERMTPEENFKFVNAFNGRMGPIIQKHKGFVNQYLGDGIMAIFPGGPQDALKAAVEMYQTLQVYNAERTKRDRQTIDMGIGLHTGPLIMGIIGDQKRMDAATISDTVNTASRIENLTKHYQTPILMSTDSVEKISSTADFHLRFLGKVRVKGKQEPIGLYECFNVDPATLAQQKVGTQPDFEKGLKLFFNQEFPQAIAIFDAIIKKNVDDQPARFFMDKASEYLLKGVPDDWTGVEVMKK